MVLVQENLERLYCRCPSLSVSYTLSCAGAMYKAEAQHSRKAAQLYMQLLFTWLPRTHLESWKPNQTKPKTASGLHLRPIKNRKVPAHFIVPQVIPAPSQSCFKNSSRGSKEGNNKTKPVACGLIYQKSIRQLILCKILFQYISWKCLYSSWVNSEILMVYFYLR